MIDPHGKDNGDMFGEDENLHPDQAMQALAGAIDPHKWKGTLSLLLAATTYTLTKALGEDVAEQLAPEIVMSQADKVGGGLMYFPKGDVMRRAMRDAQMATLYFDKGWDVDRLRRRYNLTQQTVYAILAHQKAVRRRASPDFFGFEGAGEVRKG